MKKLLVCQHVPHEILGTLNPLLKRAGFRIRYVNFARDPQAQPKLEDYHGLVVLGGPMSVYHTERFPHLTSELRLIEDAMRRDLPVLGICLGAQLIAQTLGARVYPNAEKEIGWYDVNPTEQARSDTLLAEFAATQKIFQWHGDTFDLPRGAAHLASSSLCTYQAFRYGETVYGLQFHLEVDEKMIQRWLLVPENRAELESLIGRIDPAQILTDTAAHVEALKALSARVFGRFVALFKLEKRFLQLRSR